MDDAVRPEDDPKVRRALDGLVRQAERDREALDFPHKTWIPARRSDEGEPLENILIVGAGQAGITLAHALKRDQVDRVVCIDAQPAGLEGPWFRFARMTALRTPKEYSGPEMGLPSLSFRAWYMARRGEAAWASLTRVPTREWGRYLLWVRDAVGVPVRNETRLDRIEPGGNGTYLVAHLATTQGATRLSCRKIVLATGAEGGGSWSTPSVVAGLPRRYWAHSSEDIDFAALRGCHVAVLGAAASAMDNAAMALEAGAATVRQFCRRPEIQPVQLYKWTAFPGYQRHMSQVPDAWRWRFMRHLASLGEPFTQDAWERVSRFANYRMITGAPWDRVEADGETIRIDTPRGSFEADYLICGTGVKVDLALRPELSGLEELIATWGNRYTPPPHEAAPEIAGFPYLNDRYAFTEKNPGQTPWIENIHCFSYAATASFGQSGGAIRPLRYQIPQLARGLTRDLFLADVDLHWSGYSAFSGTEFEPFPRDL